MCGGVEENLQQTSGWSSAAETVFLVIYVFHSGIVPSQRRLVELADSATEVKNKRGVGGKRRRGCGLALVDEGDALIFGGPLSPD